MSHLCPTCKSICYCNGDTDDCLIEKCRFRCAHPHQLIEHFRTYNVRLSVMIGVLYLLPFLAWIAFGLRELAQ